MLSPILFPEILTLVNKVSEFNFFEWNIEFEMIRDSIEEGEDLPRAALIELMYLLQARYHTAKSKFEKRTPLNTQRDVRNRRIRKLCRLGAAYYALRALLFNKGTELVKGLDYLAWKSEPESRNRI